MKSIFPNPAVCDLQTAQANWRQTRPTGNSTPDSRPISSKDWNGCAPLNSSDPASLQNLNDIVLPADVGWWPLAGGWYVVAAIVLLSLAWLLYRLLSGWRRNRYRREALRELSTLDQAIRTTPGKMENLRQLAVLLKRTALSAYPRRQVAALAGEDWRTFLNDTMPKPMFSPESANILAGASYSASYSTEIDQEAIGKVLSASRYWLRHHRPAPSATASGEA